MTKILSISAILHGFSWFKRYITTNIGQNILVTVNCMAEIFKFVPIYGKLKCLSDILQGLIVIFECTSNLKTSIGNFEWKIITYFPWQTA